MYRNKTETIIFVFQTKIEIDIAYFLTQYQCYTYRQLKNTYVLEIISAFNNEISSLKLSQGSNNYVSNFKTNEKIALKTRHLKK